MEQTIIKLRHIRILGLSSFELLLVFLLGLFLAPMLTWKKYLLLIFGLGIVVHALFGVNTALNWQLGLSRCPPDFNSLYGMDCP